MFDLNEAAAGRHGRAINLLDAEQIPSDGRADDIGNRIDRSDFVKVNFLDCRAVNFGFGFSVATSILLMIWSTSACVSGVGCLPPRTPVTFGVDLMA